MFHYLTIGFLAREEVFKGNTVIQSPLDREQVLVILKRYGGVPEGDSIRFPTFSIRFRDGFLYCPWAGFKHDRIVELIAKEVATTCGCLVADVRNGRLIEPNDL